MVRLALLRRFGGGMPAQCRGGGSSAGSLPWLQHVPRTAAADPDCADLLLHDLLQAGRSRREAAEILGLSGVQLRRVGRELEGGRP